MIRSKTFKNVRDRPISCIKFTLFFVIIFFGGLFVFLNQKLKKNKILESYHLKKPTGKSLQLNWTNHTNRTNFTNYTNHTNYLSEYKFFAEDIDAEIIQGDYFKFKLTTFDTNGLPKTSGGDFIYALMQDLNRSLSTAGHVEDKKDGSYTVTFYAAWSGIAEISMTLVHPSLAVDWLKNVFRPTEKKIGWITRFRKKVTVNRKKKDQFVDSLCTVVSHRNLSGNSCVYDHSSGLGETVFICRKPPEHSCKNILDIRSNVSYIDASLYSLLTNKTTQLFKSPYFMGNIGGSPSTIFIKENGSKDVSPSLGASRCGPNFDVPRPLIGGYWRGKSWISFSCKSSQQWNTSRAYSCLKNKEVYLFGDSTTRQWFDFMIKWLHLERKGQNGLTHATDKHNVSLFFNFHSWTLLTKHRRKYSEFKYEVDIIDKLPRQHCNYVIMVNLYAHFCFWPIKSYTERLTLIRESLVRLLHDCPNSQIVIKGSKPRNHPFFEANIHSSDWLLHDMSRVMREVFQGINAIFLDVWDMNLAFPAPNDMHMPEAVISQEVALFLSYICP